MNGDEHGPALPQFPFPFGGHGIDGDIAACASREKAHYFILFRTKPKTKDRPAIVKPAPPLLRTRVWAANALSVQNAYPYRGHYESFAKQLSTDYGKDKLLASLAKKEKWTDDRETNFIVNDMLANTPSGRARKRFLRHVEAWLLGVHETHPIRMVWRQHEAKLATLTPWHYWSTERIDDAIAELTTWLEAEEDMDTRVLLYPTLSEMVLARGVEHAACRAFMKGDWLGHFKGLRGLQ